MGVDSKSNWNLPATAAEWTAFMTALARGLSNPIALYNLQESAGNFADSIGTANLTASGVGTYQSPIAGWARKGASFSPGGNRFANVSGGGFGDTWATSHLILALVVDDSVAGATTSDIFGIGGSTSFRGVQLVNGDLLKYGVNDGSASPTGSKKPGLGAVRPIWLRMDKTNANNAIVTDMQTLTQTPYTLPPNSGSSAFFLGIAIAATAAKCTIAYCAVWRGNSAAAAEWSDADIAAVTTKMKNHAAVTRDATSSEVVPSTAADFAALFSLDPIAIPNLLWLPGAVASGGTGTVPDLIGTFNGTNANTANGAAATFQVAVSGKATKALQLSDGAISKVVNQDAGLPDISTTSMLAFSWANYAGTTATERSIVTLGPNYGTQAAEDLYPGTLFANAFGGGGGTASTVRSAGAATGVHRSLVQIDRTAVSTVVQTETETLTHTPTTETGKSIALGGDNVNWWFAGGVQYMLVAALFAANAELDTTARATLLDRLANGAPVVSIAISPTSSSIAPAATAALTATATLVDTSTKTLPTATWTSSAPSVATVNSSGLVTAVSAGTALITVTFTSLNAAQATSNTSTITVSSGTATLTAIAVTPVGPSVAIGASQQLVATGTYSDLHTANITSSVTWTSATPAKATVSATGLLVGVAAGTSVVTATLSAITGTTTATVTAIALPNKYTRLMMALLPPGRLWRLVPSAILATVLAACADELGRVEQRTTDLLNEADPSTAIELLPDYERELGLVSTGTTGERQARVVARTVARQRYRPIDFQNALASLLGQLPSAVMVLERSHAFAVSIGDDREIFRFFIYRDPTLPGTYFVASAQALVDQIKASHTIGTVIESISMVYDDPHSLYDRDLLGI